MIRSRVDIYPKRLECAFSSTRAIVIAIGVMGLAALAGYILGRLG